MKIGVLTIGEIEEAVLLRIQEGVISVFPDTMCKVVEEQISLRETTFDKKRKQYRSRSILSEVQCYAQKTPDLNRVLGVVNADIFVPELNFVFGEAMCPGKAALISLWRLRPEFYGNAPEVRLFHSRTVKEALHELEHTFGLKHCWRSSCVMHFSNGVFDTDVKQSLYCEKCYLQIETRIKRLK